MIGYLKGKVLIKEEDFIILDVGGVGYKIFVSDSLLENIKKSGGQIELFTWLYLKRNTIEMYGCPTEKEFEVFRTVEKISGIGPKTGVNLASFGSVEKLKKAIEKRDKKLTNIKGIGKKRTRRLVAELTDRIFKTQKASKTEKSDFDDECVSGLTSLGFLKTEAKSALSRVPKKIKSPKQRIKRALKILGTKK